jgi:hypothetical protein
VAENTVYFPEAFLAQMRAAMPAHLSFDDFIAACQRPLRRSIRVNTLKISVDDFLSLVAPYGWQLTPVPGAKRDSGSSGTTTTRCRWAAPPNISAGCSIFRKPARCCRSPPCSPITRSLNG